MYMIALAFSFFVLQALCSQSPELREDFAVHNANHIFNAIHSSLRQWGSSLNHNGMSYFLATVPAGTSLYHGTWTPNRVRGMEWLAFEPEHALVFALPSFKDDQAEQSGLDRDRQTPFIRTSFSEAQTNKYGYLHTYTARNDLRLLYIDGMSAGKSCNGTMDTQDTVLRNLTNPCPPVYQDLERGIDLCALIPKQWPGRIDGFLRMEGGFEVILCQFEAHLDMAPAVAVLPGRHFWNRGILGGWEYVKAVAARYGGIGGGRITIDYANFVSAFTYREIEGLFSNDVESDYPMPRLQNMSDDRLYNLRKDIDTMIISKDWSTHGEARNWQAVADMVVARYSEVLDFLHTDSSTRSNKTYLQAYLGTVLRPFIDYSKRDASLEVDRCISQSLPVVRDQETVSLAYRTMSTIAHRLCTTMLSAHSMLTNSVSMTPLSQALEEVDDLVEYLSWTTWKQCRGCKNEEVCWIPMWPMGSHEDHKNPRCLDLENAKFRVGYWGPNFRGGSPGDD